MRWVGTVPLSMRSAFVPATPAFHPPLAQAHHPPPAHAALQTAGCGKPVVLVHGFGEQAEWLLQLLRCSLNVL